MAPIVPGIIGCFLCGGADHFEAVCPELLPPKNDRDREERRQKYVRWFRDDDPPRIGLLQKRKLIEKLNAMKNTA